MKTKSFSSFKDTLRQSVNRSNSQLIVLLQSGLFLFLYFCRELVFGVAAFLLGYYLKNSFGTGLEIAALIYTAYLVIKYNGSLGLLMTEIAMGNVQNRAMAARASREGFRFFLNAFGAGTILFFGQTLLACPCFLFLNNFLFSPYLYVYENLRWKAARKRSKELSRGLGWFVLARTLGLVAIGYTFLAIAVILLFVHSLLAAVVIALTVIIYFAMVQSNFIWIFYNEVLEIDESQRQTPPGIKYKVLVIFSIVLIFLFYVIFRQFKI